MTELSKRIQITIDEEPVLDNPFCEYDLDLAANDNECTVDEYVETCEDVWLLQLHMISENTFITLDEYVGPPDYHSGFSEIGLPDDIKIVYATVPFNLVPHIGAWEIVEQYIDWS